MNIENDSDVSTVILNSLKQTKWGKAIFKTTFTNSGSSTPKLWVYDENITEVYFNFNEIFSVNRYFTNIFKQLLENIEKRFNKVEFEVFKDNSYKVNYYWDDEEVKKQKSKWAFVLPQWVNDRLISLLFSAGYGDEKSWQRGVFTFQIKDKQLKFEGIIFNREVSTQVKVSLPNYLIEGILEHYEITNEGMLSDEWSKWNTMIIYSPHNSLDLNKDVEYRLEN